MMAFLLASSVARKIAGHLLSGKNPEKALQQNEIVARVAVFQPHQNPATDKPSHCSKSIASLLLVGEARQRRLRDPADVFRHTHMLNLKGAPDMEVLITLIAVAVMLGSYWLINKMRIKQRRPKVCHRWASRSKEKLSEAEQQFCNSIARATTRDGRT
jgi:hypothetical protein